MTGIGSNPLQLRSTTTKIETLHWILIQRVSKQLKCLQSCRRKQISLGRLQLQHDFYTFADDFWDNLKF